MYKTLKLSSDSSAAINASLNAAVSALDYKKNIKNENIKISTNLTSIEYPINLGSGFLNTFWNSFMTLGLSLKSIDQMSQKLKGWLILRIQF